MYNITQRQKTKDLAFHWADQKGLCLFCSKEFTATFKPEYDHLNNNTHDNRKENHALVCHSCNNLKKNSAEMQVIASDKLESNERRVFACEKALADSGTDERFTSCQEISKLNKGIAKQFLLEHTMNGDSFDEKDGVYAVVNLCYDDNGSGSPSAVYKYFSQFCNKINGKYTIFSYQGRNKIRRRTEN